jgi:hypothetical protein
MNEPYAVAPFASSYSGAPLFRPTLNAQTTGPRKMTAPTSTKNHST